MIHDIVPKLQVYQEIVGLDGQLFQVPHEDFHDYTDKENISDILFIACFGCIVYLVDPSGQ